MKKLLLISLNFILSASTIICGENYLIEKQLTPTESYLNDFAIEKIIANAPSDSLSKNLPFFLHIINSERKIGFFGYHGHSQRYRIFQDILRAVFEETLSYDLPEDFYFLRIPGNSIYNFEKGTKSFYNKFDRKEASKELKNTIINELIIKPFNTHFKVHLDSSKISSSQRQILWKIVLEFLESLDTLSREQYYSFENNLNSKYLTQMPFSIHQMSKDYGNKFHSQNEWVALEEEDPFRKKLSCIKETYLLQKSNSPHFISLAANETSPPLEKMFNSWLKDYGKKGVTVSSQWVQSKYNFLGLLNQTEVASYGTHAKELKRYFFPYDDSTPTQQTVVVAMNIPLFANFHRWDESSFIVFGSNTSVEGGDNLTSMLLKKFFTQIGLKPSLVTELEDIAILDLIENDVTTGCILQFFDSSGLMHDNVDKAAYVSHSWGIPYKEVEPSQLVTGAYPLRNKTMDFQLRLITNNYTTLNPHSFLRMVRHEYLSPTVAQNIIGKMKAKLQKAPVDNVKRDAYLKELKKLWGKSPTKGTALLFSH